jgi:serine/threonine-protein kinase
MDDYRNSERFGRYEILAELGRGAMGVVYKARDPKINRVVAVKTVSLNGQPAEEEREYRERFFREAEAAGRLSHPGIVTIFDVGEEPETRAPYIVMEYVNGPTLEKMLAGEDRTMSLEAALQLTHELAEALDCAHGQGVVHRDLKPANILMTEDGHAKIADFGIAKLNLSNLTLAGRTLGTPAFMSPEQLSGEAVDGRSDLFSLGVILYTVLTGYRPFQGNSALTVSFKVVNRQPIPATVLDTDLPPGVDYIIDRAMAKDPAQRYQRGMEIVLDIQELRAGREPWSKTKEPSSFAAANAVQATTAAAKSKAAGPAVIVAKPRIGKRATAASAKQDHASHALAQLRTKPFAAALLLVAILVVGLQVRHYTAAKRVEKQALAHVEAASQLPFGDEVATTKPLSTAPIEPVPESVAPAGAMADPAPHVIKKSSHPALAVKPVSAVRAARSSQPNSTPVPALPPAVLDIEVEHKFAEAKLSIWVDDSLTYTHQLEGSDKKRMVVFHKVEGHEFHAMQISAGKHNLRVRVESGTDSYDQSSTVEGDFASGKESMLRINFSKRNEMQLSLQ